MPSDPKPARKPERFTLLEERGPNNLTPEKTGWPVAEPGYPPERFTMLEERGPNVATPMTPQPDPADVARVRELIDRLGADQLRRLIDALAPG